MLAYGPRTLSSLVGRTAALCHAVGGVAVRQVREGGEAAPRRAGAHESPRQQQPGPSGESSNRRSYSDRAARNATKKAGPAATFSGRAPGTSPSPMRGSGSGSSSNSSKRAARDRSSGSSRSLGQPPQVSGQGQANAAASMASGAQAEVLPTSNQASVNSDPTFVPRAKGIRDGVWNRNDDKLVQAASQEAQLAKQQKKASFDTGYVLLGKTAEELAALAKHFGQPSYRGAQLRDALMKGARSMDEVSNIPPDFREKLKQAGVRSGRSIIHHSVASPDGTRKFLLQLHDGRVVECVGIPLEASEEGDKEQRRRLTVCVSSQVGCPMRCTFCATGKGGFARNLLDYEIMDQVMTVQEQFGQRVTNVVFMGMGEPLLNLPSVISACKLLNTLIGIGARFLTVSTVGVPNTLHKLARADVKATLAVSIHAPNQQLREKIVPSAKAYPLQALMEDIQGFYRHTNRRVTFEYTLLAGVNDQDEHAKELAELLKRYDMQSHVNIIPWNPVDESEYQRPSRNRAYAFQRVLQAQGVEASLRLTRGLEAAAACGQLRNQHQKVPLQQFAVPT